jgi:Flp pilus assembly pilin Flp
MCYGLSPGAISSCAGDHVPPVSRANEVEYALIIASLGVVVWGAYNLMGHDIGSMANGIDSDLTNA